MNYAHGQQASGLLPHQVCGGFLCLACLQCLFTANNFAMLLCCEVILPYSEGESLPKNSLCGELLCLACCSACSLLVNSVLLVGAINLPGCCAVTLALLVYYCSALKGNPYRKLPIIQTELALPWLVAVL